jgi:hypothetical protein
VRLHFRLLGEQSAVCAGQLLLWPAQKDPFPAVVVFTGGKLQQDNRAAAGIRVDQYSPGRNGHMTIACANWNALQRSDGYLMEAGNNFGLFRGSSHPGSPLTPDVYPQGWWMSRRERWGSRSKWTHASSWRNREKNPGRATGKPVVPEGPDLTSTPPVPGKVVTRMTHSR